MNGCFVIVDWWVAMGVLRHIIDVKAGSKDLRQVSLSTGILASLLVGCQLVSD